MVFLISHNLVFFFPQRSYSGVITNPNYEGEIPQNDQQLVHQLSQVDGKIYIMTPDHPSLIKSPLPKNYHICPSKKYGFSCFPNDLETYIPSTKMATNTFQQGSTPTPFGPRPTCRPMAHPICTSWRSAVWQGFRGGFFYKVNPFLFPQGPRMMIFVPSQKKKSQVLLRNNMTTTLHKMNTF